MPQIHLGMYIANKKCINCDVLLTLFVFLNLDSVIEIASIKVFARVQMFATNATIHLLKTQLWNGPY